jgi:hypothetical protein
MIIVFVTFVAMIVVPIQTAEELETGTFGALRLAATGPEILAAKAVAVFFVEAGIFGTILDLLPFSQAAKLLGNGLSTPAPFDTGPLAWIVIAAWALLGYAILARIASRREI